MDIEYLLLLQNFREATNNVLSPFLLSLCDFTVGMWPVGIMAMIYWVFDRRAGKRIIGGYGFGLLANGFLKLTFRITRPWLRDARVVPYGDSITSATGYSFPSGHATWATSCYGGVAIWQRNRHRIISVFFVILAIMVYFARNYLGVHTPEDSAAGAIGTLIMMFMVCKVEDWTDKDPSRDLIVLVGGILVCIALVIYYQGIDIEPIYDAAGNLSVDPAKMKADSFEGIGNVVAYVICRYFERRCFHFDKEIEIKDRFIIGTFALIPLYWWFTHVFNYIAPASRSLARFVTQAGGVVYVMIIVPAVMALLVSRKIVPIKWEEAYK